MIVSCTSQEAALTKQAESIGEQKMMEAIRVEADEMLKNSAFLHNGYIEFMRHQAKVNVEDVKIINERLATATVTMMAPPVKLRRTLLEIAGKVDPSKSRRFNFSEAVNLIRKQTGISDREVQPLGVYQFRKNQDQWMAE